MDNQPKKKVGLAISGGWIRAASAIGAIQVLEENGIECELVSGCSAGSVVASAYAAGNLDNLRVRFLRGTFRDYWQRLFEPAKNGFSRGKKVTQYWRENVTDKNFEDLDKKLFLTATDLNSFTPVILNQGSVAEAIQACVNIPGMFTPFIAGDKILADGGNFNLIPSKPLYENGAEYVIAIDVSKQPSILSRALLAFKKNFKKEPDDCFPKQKPCKHPNMINLIYRGLKISSLQIGNFFSANYRCEIMIRPQINHIKRWDIGKVDYLIKRGREAALKQIVQIKHDLNLWQ